MIDMTNEYREKRYQYMTRKHIMLVDDDEHFRQLVRELLLSEPDFAVVTVASTGYEAISKAREHKPHLVLMDIRMLGMNGLEATRRLKQEMPEIKVIILTIYDEEQYREAAAASGASDYVLKAELLTELLSTIKRVFQSENG